MKIKNATNVLKCSERAASVEGLYAVLILFQGFYSRELEMVDEPEIMYHNLN